LQLRDADQRRGNQPPVADGARRVLVGPPLHRRRHGARGRTEQRVDRGGKVSSQVPPGVTVRQM